MSQIILDIGSGNTLTSIEVGKKLIDEVVKRDTKKHEVIFKTQLFEKAEPNIPLDHHIFSMLHAYAFGLGYKLTSSVFDLPSLSFLLKHDNKYAPLPFVKLACRPDLYWLIGEVPRRVPVYVSLSPYASAGWPDCRAYGGVNGMYCVPEYPAKEKEYGSAWGYFDYVSDHTVGLGLYKKHR